MAGTTTPPSSGRDPASDPAGKALIMDGNPTSAGNGNSVELLRYSTARPHTLCGHALGFLSRASTGTLASLGVGLLLTIYLLLGGLGLLLIGLVSGVVLNASWEGFREDNGNGGLKSNVLQRRKELGVE